MLLTLFSFVFIGQVLSVYQNLFYYGGDTTCTTANYIASTNTTVCVAVACVCTLDICVQTTCTDNAPEFASSDTAFVEEIYLTNATCEGGFTTAIFIEQGCIGYGVGLYYKATCENGADFCSGIYSDATCTTPLVQNGIACYNDLSINGDCQDFSTVGVRISGCGGSSDPSDQPSEQPSEQPTIGPSQGPTDQPTNAPTDCMIGRDFSCRFCGDVCPQDSFCNNFLGDVRCRPAGQFFDAALSNGRVRAAIVDYTRYSTPGRTVTSITFAGATATTRGEITFNIAQSIPLQNLRNYVEQTLIPLLLDRMEFLLEGPCFGRCLYYIEPTININKRDELQAVVVGVSPGYSLASGLTVQLALAILSFLVFLL